MQGLVVDAIVFLVLVGGIVWLWKNLQHVPRQFSIRGMLFATLLFCIPLADYRLAALASRRDIDAKSKMEELDCCSVQIHYAGPRWLGRILGNARWHIPNVEGVASVAIHDLEKVTMVWQELEVQLHRLEAVNEIFVVENDSVIVVDDQFGENLKSMLKDNSRP